MRFPFFYAAVFFSRLLQANRLAKYRRNEYNVARWASKALAPPSFASRDALIRELFLRKDCRYA